MCGGSKIMAVTARHSPSRIQFKSPGAVVVVSATRLSRSRSAGESKWTESTISRSAGSSSDSTYASCSFGRSPSHQNATGMSGMSSALTSGGMRWMRSPPATMEISSEHTCFPPLTRWQFALIHDAISGLPAGSERMMMLRCGTAALALLSVSLACACCSREDVCATTFHSAARVSACSPSSLLLRQISARLFSMAETSTRTSDSNAGFVIVILNAERRMQNVE